MMVFNLFTGLCVVAVVLFAWAWRGRRVGDEKRCRRCEYNLTGLVSSQCPECGTDVSDARNVVVGLRIRRKGWAYTGLVVLALGLAGLGAPRSHSLTYQVLPFRVVLWSADHGDERALDELARRQSARGLSTSQLKVLGEHCLDAQRGTENVGGKDSQKWIRILERMDRSTQLPPAKHTQYIEQYVSSITFDMPERISLGRKVTGTLSVSLRDPGTSFCSQPMLGPFLHFNDEQVRIDGRTIESRDPTQEMEEYWTRARHGKSSSGGGLRWESTPRITTTAGLGQHTLEYSVRLSLARLDQPNAVLWSEEVSETRDFEIVPADR